MHNTIVSISYNARNIPETNKTVFFLQIKGSALGIINMGTEPTAHPFIKLHNKKSYIDYSACRFWENKIKVLFQLRLLVLFSKLHLIFLRISTITLKLTCVYLYIILIYMKFYIYCSSWAFMV